MMTNVREAGERVSSSARVAATARGPRKRSGSENASPPVSEDLLALDSVTAGYGPILAVRGLSLRVRPGEIVALLGPNGAGKSTTLMMIAGLVRARSGHIRLEGREINRLRPEDIVRRGVSLAPEGRHVFAQLPVIENLRIGATPRRNRSGIEQDLKRMLEWFPVLQERQQQSAGTLSGGEQQMLSLARSLMSGCRLLLLDEPSLGLAPRVVGEIYAHLKRLPSLGVAVLLVEQNMRVALRAADRVYIMTNGEVRMEGSAAEIAQNPSVSQLLLGTTDPRGPVEAAGSTTGGDVHR